MGPLCLRPNPPPWPSPPGQPFDPSLLLAQATSNIICSLTFGLRFPYDDQEFQAVVRAAGGILLGTSSRWGQVSGWDLSLATRLPQAPMRPATLLPADLRDVLLAPAEPPRPPHTAPQPHEHVGHLRHQAGAAAPGESGRLGPPTGYGRRLPAEDGKGGGRSGVGLGGAPEQGWRPLTQVWLGVCQPPPRSHVSVNLCLCTCEHLSLWCIVLSASPHVPVSSVPVSCVSPLSPPSSLSPLLRPHAQRPRHPLTPRPAAPTLGGHFL